MTEPLAFILMTLLGLFIVYRRHQRARLNQRSQRLAILCHEDRQ